MAVQVFAGRKAWFSPNTPMRHRNAWEMNGGTAIGMRELLGYMINGENYGLYAFSDEWDDGASEIMEANNDMGVGNTLVILSSDFVNYCVDSGSLINESSFVLPIPSHLHCPFFVSHQTSSKRFWFESCDAPKQTTA